MNILFKQYLGENHSWATTGRGLANSFKKNHSVDLFSTDGVEHIGSLKENVIGYTLKNERGGQGNEIFGKEPENKYDLQIGYTSPVNFKRYFDYSKVKFAIWCHEWNGKNILPLSFMINFKYVDKILVPSLFAKDILLNSGLKEDRIEVVPHGVDESFANTNKYDFGLSDSTFKIFTNIAQPHKRKNVQAVLESYGKAFTNKDDVCLILKIRFPKALSFDDDINKLLKEFKLKYKNHAQLKIINNFIDDISSLYRASDACFTMSHCEGYYYPGHEALVSGIMNIAPNYGGQLDFLNKENSLLVDGKIVRCPQEYMYSYPSANAVWFEPDIDLAADSLRFAKDNYKSINEKLSLNKANVYNKTNWDMISKKIISLM